MPHGRETSRVFTRVVSRRLRVSLRLVPEDHQEGSRCGFGSNRDVNPGSCLAKNSRVSYRLGGALELEIAEEDAIFRVLESR